MTTLKMFTPLGSFCLDNIEEWLKAQVLEPDCLGLNPSTATYWLCNSGHVTNLFLCPSFLICTKKEKN